MARGASDGRALFGSVDRVRERTVEAAFVFGIDATADTAFRDQSASSRDRGPLSPRTRTVRFCRKETPEYFGLKAGDEIVLSVRTRFGAFNTGILTVRGIYENGNYFSGGLTLAHFDFLRKLDLADDGAATSVFVFFDAPRDLGKKRDILSADLARRGFEVSFPKSDTEAIAAVSSASTKYEADKEGRDRTMLTVSTIDEVLGIVRKVLAAVNAVVCRHRRGHAFVTAVSVFINLRMTVSERLREIGTMRAIGVGSAGVTALFVLESVILAVLFSSAGAGLASGASLAIRHAFVFPASGNLAVFLDGGHLALDPDTRRGGRGRRRNRGLRGVLLVLSRAARRIDTAGRGAHENALRRIQYAQNQTCDDSADRAHPACRIGMAETNPAASSSDPSALKVVRAFEDKLNLEGLDVTNTFTLVQKSRARRTGFCGSECSGAMLPTRSRSFFSIRTARKAKAITAARTTFFSTCRRRGSSYTATERTT